MPNLAKLFAGGGGRRKPPPPFKKKAAGGKGASLDAYKRTYGEKDGRIVFEAAQIKAKRKGKR